MKNIHGNLLRTCYMDLDSFERGAKSGVFHVESNFKEEYRKHLIALEQVATSAKAYLIKNWEKVQDWSNLNIIIKDNSKKKTEYYNHTPDTLYEGASDLEKKFHDIMNEVGEKKHNPINSLGKVVLDTTDGDFSLTINGNDHLWISDDSVIALAAYVEQQLEKQK